MGDSLKKIPAAKKKSALNVERLAQCGFCGLDQEQVDVLIRGERDAYICGECVELARDLVGARRLGILPVDGPEVLQSHAGRGKKPAKN